MIQCGDCGCLEGEFHEKYCTNEICPKCGQQLFLCGHRVSQKNRVRFTKPVLPCDDCGKNIFENHNYYMVHDEIWNSVAKRDENLCMSCLEKKLGRKLTLNDLPPVPVNIMAMGERLFSEVLPPNWIAAIESYYFESKR